MPPRAERPIGWLILLAGLAVGGAIRLVGAWTDHGIYWPDEIYQSLEPAHRLVFGYGLTPWEFIEGARNWALPGLVAALLKGAQLWGLDQPAHYLGLIKAAFALIGLLTALGSYRLARVYGADPVSAAVGATLFALATPALYFAPRAMSEVASALPATLGLAWVLRPGAKRSELWWGASLLGLAVLLRLQLGVFCVGAVAILLARRQWRQAGEVLAVLALWALAFGYLDHRTWHDVPGAVAGGWFHSARKYLQFNLVNDGASAWGVSPWYFYAQHLFRSMSGVAVALVLGTALAFRRARGLVLLAATFFALHAWVGHKELRFVYPLLPVLAALAGVGLAQLPGEWRYWVASPLFLLAAVASALHYPHLTFGELGAYANRPQASAHDDFGAVNRLLLKAYEQPDLCGLRIDVAHLAWTGGHSYLHRPVPLYHQGHPPVERRHFNYLITWNRPGLAGVVAQDPVQPIALIRLFPSCVPDPGYSWRLP